MAMDDLYQALNMFKSGVNELQTSRVLQGANDQVQQIKASEASEADKRNQLTALSHQLVGQMGALGVPVDQIQTQAQNILPKQYANANAMSADALLTGNAGLGAEAKQQQAFEQDPEYKKELIQAKAMYRDPLKMMQFQALQDDRLQKHIEGLDKRVDAQTSRFGNIAKLQGVNNQIQDARTLLDSGNIDKRTMRELAVKYDGMLSQGSSTISGADHLEPKTRAQYLAGIQEFLTNKPKNIADDVKGFTDYYKQAFDRLEGVNKNIISEGQKQVIGPMMQQVAKHNPGAIRDYIETKLPGTTADIDPKTGRIKFRPAGGPSPAQTPAVTFTPTMRQNSRTGKMEKLLLGSDGKLYQPDGN